MGQILKEILALLPKGTGPWNMDEQTESSNFYLFIFFYVVPIHLTKTSTLVGMTIFLIYKKRDNNGLGGHTTMISNRIGQLIESPNLGEQSALAVTSFASSPYLSTKIQRARRLDSVRP